MNEHGPHCDGCLMLAVVTERDELKAEVTRLKAALAALTSQSPDRPKSFRKALR